MAIPERILVSRSGGNYSSCMGFYSLDVDDNQFWGQVVASFPPQQHSPDWQRGKCWYAVLHRFSGWGKHIGSDHWYAGKSSDGEVAVCRRASAKLDEMNADLGEIEWADIEIELFQVVIDGVVFGMVDVSQPEEGPEFAERVEMQPGSLLFRAPWDGNYDT